MIIKTVFGILLLLIPFLLVDKFKDKKRGFYICLFGIIVLQFLIGFITQLFGIFSYISILIINIFVDAIVIFNSDFKKGSKDLKKIKVDWILILLVLIVFFSLWSVHHNYSGIVTSINEPFNQAENLKYTYPFLSDEWNGISFIEYSIKSGKLPFVNSLWFDSPFVNLGFGIYSLGGEMMMILDLNPLTDYIWLSLFSGLLVSLLIYFILKESKLGKITSLITAISVIYITRGANLPGLWNYVPLVGGIIFLLFSILFLILNEKKLSLSSVFFSLIFYPPLVIFLIPMFLFYFINTKKNLKNLKWLISLILISGIFLIFISRFITGLSFSYIFSFLGEKFFYPTFTPRGIPDFSIWKVVPKISLIFSIIALISFFKRGIIKKKLWLIAPIFVGLLYWIIYSKVFWRFIIEYERVVVTTSILIVLISGFGLDCFLNFLRKVIKNDNLGFIIIMIFLIIIFMMPFYYTQNNSWNELMLKYSDDEVSPASPANIYLHPDDLVLFENISEKKFLSVPWKGLVIGTSTHNYPLQSKQATLTNNFYDYNDFKILNCEEKYQAAIDYEIEYVYTEEFNCEGFEEIGRSEEGFVLYKTERN